MSKEKKDNKGSVPEKKAPARQPRQKGALKEYFKGVRTEMKKVVWPTKEELGNYTLVVIATCAFFGLLFFAFDAGFLAALKALLGVKL